MFVAKESLILHDCVLLTKSLISLFLLCFEIGFWGDWWMRGCWACPIRDPLVSQGSSGGAAHNVTCITLWEMACGLCPVPPMN